MKGKPIFVAVITILMLTISVCVVVISRLSKTKKAVNDIMGRYKDYYNLVLTWFLNKNTGFSIAKAILDSGYKDIAIYGMGTIADILLDELEGSEINVRYLIDKTVDNGGKHLENRLCIGLYAISDQETVDAIIVTPVAFFDEIASDLHAIGVNTEIISLDEFIY